VPVVPKHTIEQPAVIKTVAGSGKFAKFCRIASALELNRHLYRQCSYAQELINERLKNGKNLTGSEET